MIVNLENEIWKDIEGYEGLYKISNMGRIKSYPRVKGCIYFEEQLLNQHNNKSNKNEKGYLYVDLYNDGVRKRFYVHRLVADAFIENINNYPVINHKDNNAYNNIVDNLEWCTQKYNCNYGDHNKKLSEALKGKNSGKDSYNAKSVICLTTGMVFDTITEASIYYHIENLRSAISSWCKGSKKFNYLGKLEDGTKLQWMYYEDFLKQKNNYADYKEDIVIDKTSPTEICL